MTSAITNMDGRSPDLRFKQPHSSSRFTDLLVDADKSTSDIMNKASPNTVAGAVAAFHCIPFSPVIPAPSQAREYGKYSGQASLPGFSPARSRLRTGDFHLYSASPVPGSRQLAAHPARSRHLAKPRRQRPLYPNPHGIPRHTQFYCAFFGGNSADLCIHATHQQDA